MTGQANNQQNKFVFGGDTGMSYEQLQARKKIAESLASNVFGRAPQNIGEGLNAVGNALLYRGMMNKIEKGETQGRGKARELIAAALQGRDPNTSSTGPMTMFGAQGQTAAPFYPPGASSSVSPAPPRTPEQEIGDDTMAALGKDGAMSNEGRILKGLTDRGLPEHVAQGFLMNFRDESGLNPGINEQNPIVPGSRGGFGLAQWTGPRRRQLEAFAAQQGKPVSDLDLQLDFLMTELQGSEAKAGQSILSSRNAPEAATAIVNDFLRPAEEHRARRAAQYGGGTPEPQQSDYSDFYAALSSPWVGQEQKAMLMSELEDRKAADRRAYDRWARDSDPLRQMQLERGRLELEQMRNPQPGFSMLTPEQETQMGLDPAGSYQRGADGKISRIGGGGTHVNVTTGSAEPDRYLYGTDAGLPQGWRYDREAGTAEPIPGGPAAVEAQENAGKEANKNRQAKLKLGTSLTSIGLNLAEIEDGGLPVTGAVGDLRRTGVGQFLTGSAAVDFGNRTNQITDSAAFAEIQNMRDNSPTGGAVGQLTDKERAAIGNAVTALNNSTSAEEYTRAAKAYRKLALDLSYGEGQWQMLNDGTFEAVTEGSARPAITQQSGGNVPQVGVIEDGYRFLGGDPQSPESWEKVN